MPNLGDGAKGAANHGHGAGCRGNGKEILFNQTSMRKESYKIPWNYLYILPITKNQTSDMNLPVLRSPHLVKFKN